MTDKILISLKDALARRYQIRKSGTGSGLEASLPREVIEREARRLQISIEEFIQSYDIEWLYNDFHGLHARFIEKKK